MKLPLIDKYSVIDIPKISSRQINLEDDYKLKNISHSPLDESLGVALEVLSGAAPDLKIYPIIANSEGVVFKNSFDFLEERVEDIWPGAWKMVDYAERDMVDGRMASSAMFSNPRISDSASVFIIKIKYIPSFLDNMGDYHVGAKMYIHAILHELYHCLRFADKGGDHLRMCGVSSLFTEECRAELFGALFASSVLQDITVISDVFDCRLAGFYSQSGDTYAVFPYLRDVAYIPQTRKELYAMVNQIIMPGDGRYEYIKVAHDRGPGNRNWDDLPDELSNCLSEYGSALKRFNTSETNI